MLDCFVFFAVVIWLTMRMWKNCLLSMLLPLPLE
jgi:hypothetical protein